MKSPAPFLKFSRDAFSVQWFAAFCRAFVQNRLQSPTMLRRGLPLGFLPLGNFFLQRGDDETAPAFVRAGNGAENLHRQFHADKFG
jgi:hypothetical protein